MSATGESDISIDHVSIIAGASVEERGIGRFAESLGHFAQDEIVVGVFEGTGNLFPFVERVADGIFEGDESILQIRIESAPAPAIHIGVVRRWFGGVAAHQAVGRVDVETANAFQICVADGGGGVIADHFLGVAIPGGIDGKPTSLLAHGDERLHHIGIAVGGEDGEQGMEGAERVPERKIAIVGEAAGDFSAAFARKSRVGARHIAEGVGHQKAVVEGGIKDAAAAFGGALDLNFSQGFVPDAKCGCSDRFKIPAGDFGVQIAARFLDTHERGANFYRHGFARGGSEADVGAGRAAAAGLADGALVYFGSAPDTAGAEWPIEAGDKVTAESGGLAGAGVLTVNGIGA